MSTADDRPISAEHYFVGGQTLCGVSSKPWSECTERPIRQGCANCTILADGGSIIHPVKPGHDEMRIGRRFFRIIQNGENAKSWTAFETVGSLTGKIGTAKNRVGAIALILEYAQNNPTTPNE